MSERFNRLTIILEGELGKYEQTFCSPTREQLLDNDLTRLMVTGYEKFIGGRMTQAEYRAYRDSKTKNDSDDDQERADDIRYPRQAEGASKESEADQDDRTIQERAFEAIHKLVDHRLRQTRAAENDEDDRIASTEDLLDRARRERAKGRETWKFCND